MYGGVERDWLAVDAGGGAVPVVRSGRPYRSCGFVIGVSLTPGAATETWKQHSVDSRNKEHWGVGRGCGCGALGC